MLKFTLERKSNKILEKSTKKGKIRDSRRFSRRYLISEHRKEMIGLEIHNFNLNRILLLIIDLWPLQQSNLTRLQFVLMSAILTAGIMFQVSHYSLF